MACMHIQYCTRRLRWHGGRQLGMWCLPARNTLLVAHMACASITGLPRSSAHVSACGKLSCCMTLCARTAGFFLVIGGYVRARLTPTLSPSLLARMLWTWMRRRRRCCRRRARALQTHSGLWEGLWRGQFSSLVAIFGGGGSLQGACVQRKVAC